MEKFIKKIAQDAGNILADYYGKVGVKYTKAHIFDVVTEADLQANKFLINQIKKKFPNHGIISEETGNYNINKEYVWTIDPLDGTLNYSKSIPFFCVLIGLAKNRIFQFGVAYDPIHKELYYAKKGKGAFLNGKRVHCSKPLEFSALNGLYSNKLTNDKLNFLKNLKTKLSIDKFFVGSLGSSGLSAVYVASGKMDWFISTEGKIWDYAATAVILKEAGAKVTDLKGRPISINSTGMVCAYKPLHQAIIKVLKK